MELNLVDSAFQKCLGRWLVFAGESWCTRLGVQGQTGGVRLGQVLFASLSRRAG